ncbi:MAG TPA: MurR/RpiR family transcriptional regulator [Streptosporangiaceae bacterium]
METTDPSESPLSERITRRLATLSPAERRVAEYLRNHTEEMVFATAEQIGSAVGTSDATVVRTAKALGYSGLPDLKHEVGQRIVLDKRPATRLHRRIERVGPEPSAALDHVFDEAVERLRETRRLLAAQPVHDAVELLDSAGRILTFGVGASEVAARYMALRLRRIGRRAQPIIGSGFCLADELLDLGGGDVIICYAPGRLLDDLTVVIDHAAETGARIVLVSDSLGPVLAGRVALTLSAVHSPSGLTGECLSSMTLSDALLLALAARDEPRSTAASDLLTQLRTGLIGRDAAVYVPLNERPHRD